jgi:hypothetical protein
MTEPWMLLALVATGMAAGFINVVAGGGSLLTVPLLIFLGLPENTANGTSRLALLVQNAVALAKYHREGRLDVALLRRLALPAIAGAALGAVAATRISDAAFRTVLAWVMLGCALLVAVEPMFRSARRTRTGGATLSAARVWPTLFAIGLYGGLVQAGVGYLILAGLTIVLGVDLVQANIQKVAIVFVYTPIAFLVFSSDGLVAWGPAVVLCLGQALGGWLGAREALRRGEGFIRATLVAVVVLSAVKLLT